MGQQWPITLQRPKLAIVPGDLFEAAERRRRKRSHNAPATHHSYELSGLVRCGECGHSYVAQASSNREGRYVYMTCGNRARGATCTNRLRFRLDIARQAAMAPIAEALFTPEAVEEVGGTGDGMPCDVQGVR